MAKCNQLTALQRVNRARAGQTHTQAERQRDRQTDMTKRITDRIRGLLSAP